MDARERWRALQAHLNSARVSLETGDRAAAVEAVRAALAIDPDYPAAQAMRDAILGRPKVDARSASVAPLAVASPAADIPLVSKEGFARFEQRAKRRRVDRRLDAARTAIARGQLKQAEAALDEVIELDPNLPDLVELAAQFDELRRNSAGSHGGRWLAAAAVFGAIVLGASWLHEAGGLRARSVITIASLVTPPVSSLMLAIADQGEPDMAVPVPTTGPEPVESVRTLPPPQPRAILPALPPPASVAAASTSTAAAAPPIVAPPAAPPAPVPAPPPQRVAEAPPPVAPPAAQPVMPAAYTAAASAPPPVTPAAIETPPAPPATARPEPLKQDDEVLVKQILQRYRTAYEGLDARSARVVWPAVDEIALARAFDGLQSQSLTFDACDVQLRGESAAATCRGSSRYVPKVGNHEPRVEPRTWNFTLKRDGTDWKIESARAGR